MSTKTKTKTPAKNRDASLEKLQALMDSPTAPGQDQAKKAVEKSKVPAKNKPKDSSNVVEAKVAEPKKKTKPKKTAGEGKAQNMGLSLHPADQDRIYEVEAAVRKAGIKGRPSTSLLIKLALATFDPSKIDNLAEVYEQLESQDGRRRKV